MAFPGGGGWWVPGSAVTELCLSQESPLGTHRQDVELFRVAKRHDSFVRQLLSSLSMPVPS